MKYIFYRFHQLMVSVGNGDIAAFAALLLFGFMLFLNLVMLKIVLYWLSGHRSYLIGTNKVEVLAELVVIFLALYVLLIHRRRLDGILAFYAGEPESARKRGRWVCLAYILVSVLGVMGSFLLIN